ncbi:MAG: hypothetical protein OK438_00565 [Thaumarchaeota archaeon]|nr:hypothetical protein [Nitrososphaerota archaeon]
MTPNITSRGHQHRRHRRGISGILAAVILFAMIFTTGFGYLLFVTQGSLSISQANAARQDALLQAGQEALLSKVVVAGGTTLVLSVNNTGGTPVSLSRIYIDDNTGKMITPPGFMGPGGGTNATANWPISLPVGQSTNTLGGCVAGKTGCNIALTSYTYAGASVSVEIVTSKGNTFGTPYPPISTLTSKGNALVVKMLATPSQTLSCTGCVTVTVTVYNYAPSSVTGVALSPSPPTAQVTGTASVTGGSCLAPVPSNTIVAYSGSGNAPSITFTCTYNAQTGAVGGLATFSTSAIGTLNAKGVSSAVAMSNNIQIGGNSNVPTQGAFAVNYFFLKFSACQYAPSGSVGSYTYSSPCVTTPVTMPPTSPYSLTNGNYISAISDYYVAYYVQVTNVFNATLPILEYSYLFMDPSVSTEAFNFLVGTATNPQVPYYPNYCGSIGCGGDKLPLFTPYAATAATCAESPPNYNPPSPTQCIDVAPGQTVTLTFAACGYGASNWVWGGTPYAQQLDHSAGCITTPPNFKGAVPEGQTLGVVLSYLYKNQAYSQVMPFEGQTLTNVRTSSTAVACSPSPVAVNAPSTCTMTVTDTAFGNPFTPTGMVTLTQTPGTGGTISNGGTCTLSGSGATATCVLTFTPALGQEITNMLNATYPGDTNHSPSWGITSLTATQRSTSTTEICSPSYAVPNTPTNCVTTVTDNSPGNAVTPTGTISFTQSPLSSGTFTPLTTCPLSQVSPGVASCPITYTPNPNFQGTVTVTGSYGGDTDHAVSSNAAQVKWARSTLTSVSCASPVVVGSPSACTLTVTDTYTGIPITPTGTVTLSQSLPSTGTFSNGGSCVLSGGSCAPFTFTPGSGQVWPPSVTITASYPGDANHIPSSGSASIHVNGASPMIATLVSSSGTISIGGSATDQGTFSNGYGTLTGTLVFRAYTSSACSSGLSFTSNTITVSGNGPYTSNPYTPSLPGSYPAHYYYQATFTDTDGNNIGFTSACGGAGETLTVNKASPTIATTVSSGGTISIGGSATDQGTFSNGYGTLTGTLVFKAYSASSCLSGLSFTSNTITVNGNGPYTSNSFAPNPAGTYYYQATFTDTDGNNIGFTSACGGAGETLTVNKASPTIATTLSATTIQAAGSVFDRATLSGTFGSAGGTVQYEYFTGSSCPGSPSNVGSAVTVSGGAVPNSVSQTFNTAGLYGWEAVYSGDANNNGATSSCEPLSVLSLTVSPTSVSASGTSSQRRVTLQSSSAGYDTSTTYNYCMSTSAVSITCVGGTSGTFTGTGATGTIPSGTRFTVPHNQATGTYYVIIYTGATIWITATLTVTP